MKRNLFFNVVPVFTGPPGGLDMSNPQVARLIRGEFRFYLRYSIRKKSSALNAQGGVSGVAPFITTEEHLQ